MADYSKLFKLNKPVTGDECTYTHVRITVDHERTYGRTYYMAYYTYVVQQDFTGRCTCERSYPFDVVNVVNPVGNSNGYARASKSAATASIKEALMFYNRICLAGNELEV